MIKETKMTDNVIAGIAVGAATLLILIITCLHIVFPVDRDNQGK